MMHEALAREALTKEAEHGDNMHRLALLDGHTKTC